MEWSKKYNIFLWGGAEGGSVMERKYSIKVQIPQMNYCFVTRVLWTISGSLEFIYRLPASFFPPLSSSHSVPARHSGPKSPFPCSLGAFLETNEQKNHTERSRPPQLGVFLPRTVHECANWKPLWATLSYCHTAGTQRSLRSLNQTQRPAPSPESLFTTTCSNSCQRASGYSTLHLSAPAVRGRHAYRNIA